MGRPKLDETFIKLSITVDRETYDHIRKVSYEIDKTKSEAIRYIIKKYFEMLQEFSKEENN